jgi:hypothetical protein
MNEQMKFPETFEKFAKEYGFKDDKEIYTNGSDLIPIFRVKQWLEYDNKLRRIETDTAYECGKHANKWIPVSEKLPDKEGYYLCSVRYMYPPYNFFEPEKVKYMDDVTIQKFDGEFNIEVKAWMPLPPCYKPQESEEQA